MAIDVAVVLLSPSVEERILEAQGRQYR